MTSSKPRMIAVLSAAAVVLALAASLAVRVLARSGEAPASPSAALPSAPAPPRAPAPATVPLPPAIVLAELPTPFCWGCSWNEDARLEFQVDLDLLAPLGDGRSNAAAWFEQFAHDDSYRERRIEITIDGQEWKVFPGDDSLLLEAEPWIDQATMSFYPEVWELRGMDTPFPNLLMTLDLARSWVVRGKLSEDADLAREDFRRAVRLGRLLRQDDATIIQDLVAIACVRLGAEAMYELARSEGDAATMTVAALVMADKDAMRQGTARRITTLERGFRVEDPEAATLTLRLNDAELDSIIEVIRNIPERRFRMEGLIGMHTVSYLGTPAQQAKARAVLDEFSESDDELTAGMARHLLTSEFDPETLLE